jgi:thiol-disulfide isomerase/thioredoxin
VLASAVFSQAVKPSKIEISAKAGRYIVSGTVNSEGVRYVAIRILREQLSKNVSAEQLRVDPVVAPFLLGWEAELKAFLNTRKSKRSVNGLWVFKTDEEELVRNLDELLVGYRFVPVGGKRPTALIVPAARATLVSLFATWCSPCRIQLSELQGLFERYHAKGLNVVALDADREISREVARVVGQLGITFPTGSASEVLVNKLSQRSKFGGIPITVLVRDGRIERIFVAASPKTSQELQTAVEALFR